MSVHIKALETQQSYYHFQVNTSNMLVIDQNSFIAHFTLADPDHLEDWQTLQTCNILCIFICVLIAWGEASAAWLLNALLQYVHQVVLDIFSLPYWLGRLKGPSYNIFSETHLSYSGQISLHSRFNSTRVAIHRDVVHWFVNWHLLVFCSASS